MSQYDLEVFILCLIVFIASCVVFGFVLVYVFKLETKCINHGLFDEEIKQSTTKPLAKQEKALVITSWVLSGIVVLIIFATFVFALVTYVTRFDKVGEVPAIKVVQSSSMERKDEHNAYLKENNLDDQIKMYDLVLIHQIPDEFDLQLYDVVVYETVDGNFVIHRIIDIEEPNAEHPDVRHFTFRGDNVQYSDKRPVLYEQMIGIYRGERVGFWGKIVMFFQSYAGYLCLGLVVFYLIVMPIVEKKLEKVVFERKKVLFLKDEPFDKTSSKKEQQ